jgi:hypothetical protein
MNLPSQLRIRALSWLSVAVLTAMSLLALVYVLPYKGLAQLSREGVQVTGQGAAEFRRGNPVPACTFEISAEGDPTTGTFTCAMSDQSVDLGTPFRSIDGQVTTAAASRDRGRLEGTATLELPDGSQMDSVAFVLRVRVGGVDQGALKIRLLGVFDGDPGDAKVGNDAYDQRWQFLTDGSIDIEPGPSPRRLTRPRLHRATAPRRPLRPLLRPPHRRRLRRPPRSPPHHRPCPLLPRPRASATRPSRMPPSRRRGPAARRA